MSYSAEPRLVCVVRDNIIYEVGAYNTQQNPIGRTNSWCDELVSVANEYKQICIDGGLIEKEKTPEEIQAEMQQMIKTQNELMKTMADTIKASADTISGMRNEINSMKSELGIEEKQKIGD